MNHILKTIFMIGVVLTVSVGSVHAAVLIDFEAYADTQNLNGANLGGVTITAPLGSVEVFSNGRFGVEYHSAVNAIGNFQSGSPYQDNPLIGVFDAPVTSISLWAGDGGYDMDSWMLQAFDAVIGGNLLGTVNSMTWNGSPYTQLAITSGLGNIWRFEAVGTGPSIYGIGYDDLEFNVSSSIVPEPISLIIWTIFATLGVTLVWWRKRRPV